MDREPNTQECAFYGRKLSNTVFEGEADGNVCIGSDNDDSIYFHDCEYGDVLKERVTVHVDFGLECGEIDLEDLLKFCAEHCRELMIRVLEETPHKLEHYHPMVKDLK
jgi:hypothetical protein